MKSKILLISFALAVFQTGLLASEALKINFLNLKNCSIPTAASALSLSTKLKIVCTEKTAAKNVSLLIRDISALDALKLICKSTSLVYRFDENSQFYTLMTLEEYRENAVVEGREEIKIFKLEPANLDLIAETIESLYEKQVVLTQNDEIVDFSESTRSGSSDRDRSSSNRSDSNREKRRDTKSQNGENPEEAAVQNLSSEDAFALEDSSRNKKGVFDLFSGTFGGPRIYVTTNREHNMLIIKSSDIAALDEIERLIQRIDEPMPQVILEMKILSLDIGNDERIGFDYNFAGGDSYSRPDQYDDQGNPTSFSFLGLRDELTIGQNVVESGNTLAYRYINENLIARLQMKAQDNQADVIATPILIAANNREAKIEVGKERIITTGASVSTDSSVDNGGVGTITTITYDTEVRTIGTTLTIIPRINKDRTVTLYVEQENSTLVTGGNTLLVDDQTITVDAVDTANIQATVVAKDRFTIAVGGLITSERSEIVSKVPILGDIPILGKAFSKNEGAVNKSELILLIRPYIIDGSIAADSATKSLVERLSSHQYIQEGDQAIDQNNNKLQNYLDHLLQDAAVGAQSDQAENPITN
jgi:general secretion pathway protein D